MSAIRIDVTQDDINRGKREHCLFCPVALAMERAVGEVVFVHKSEYVIVYNQPLPMPAEASEWILQFDIGGAEFVEPFSFEIPAP